jgi:hypothetical protein
MFGRTTVILYSIYNERIVTPNDHCGAGVLEQTFSLLDAFYARNRILDN